MWTELCAVHIPFYQNRKGCQCMTKRINTAVWVESANRWQINVQKEGKRRTFISRKAGRTGQREANKKADAWLDEGLETRTAKVNEWYEKFIAKKKQITSTSNWRPMESRYNNWIKPAIGNKKLETIKEQTLQDIIDDAYSKGLSKKSLQSLCADLRAFFKFCRRSGVTTINPEGLAVPGGARTEDKSILQPEDIKVLFSMDTTSIEGKIQADPYIHAYRLQVLTGMRPSEVIGLKWENITDTAIQIKGGINIYGEQTKGKNANSVRSVPMSALVKKELNAQGRQRKGFVFPILSEKHYYKRLKIYCETNNITVVTPYELRHTFVSIAQVLPEAMVKQIVGHSRSMDTFGVYGHLVDGQAATAAEQMDSIFTEIQNQKGTR